MFCKLEIPKWALIVLPIKIQILKIYSLRKHAPLTNISGKQTKAKKSERVHTYDELKNNKKLVV